jgi:vacuolar-type H+-ATPase subunit F/Vma7
MSTVAVLGAEAQIQGYALAGAVPIVAETAAEARRQWAALPPGVAAVVLTPSAAAALAEQAAAPDAPMTAVMPA